MEENKNITFYLMGILSWHYLKNTTYLKTHTISVNAENQHSL